MRGNKHEHTWISVKDKLPEAGIDVLIWDITTNKVEKAFMSYAGIKHGFLVVGINDDDLRRTKEANYWMPLPEPPEGLC